MPIQTTDHIWHNGEFIPWDDAKLHVMSHVVHYGSSVFEGIRCYQQADGASGIFRLTEHIQRLFDSAKIYRMPIPFSLDQLCTACVQLVESNRVTPCYLRPVAFRGYGELGVYPLHNPVEVFIANYAWGKYVSGHNGADVCVSSWTRLAPNTLPAMAKAGANYMNSQLIRMEAAQNGYDEGIALDTSGHISEGSGENIFLVRNGKLVTPPLSNSALAGITRDSVLKIAEMLSLQVIEQPIPREMLYISDEVFFTGTAAEITPIRSVDRILVADGKPGPVTQAIAEEFFGIVEGRKPDRFGWLTPVQVRAHAPVAV